MLPSNPGTTIEGRRGIKLEKNSVLKMGRVRLRVRDIDYADQIQPVKPVISSPAKGSAATQSPSKKANSAQKLKGNADMKYASNDDGPIDLNEIKLLE